MSGEGSIGPVGPAAPVAPGSAGSAGPAALQAQSPAAGGGLFPPNPSVHLDLALNLVVLEFRDDAGNVTSSIPSARQLQAYRLDGGPAAFAAHGGDAAVSTRNAAPEGLSRLG